jgi:hypothetical protein
MKKSDILDAVYLEMVNNWSESMYICNTMKTMYTRGDLGDDSTPVEQLLQWIDKSISKCEHASARGVAAWLFKQGHITAADMMVQLGNREIKQYRMLWLKDMAAYWKSKGQ